MQLTSEVCFDCWGRSKRHEGLTTATYGDEIRELGHVIQGPFIVSDGDDDDDGGDDGGGDGPLITADGRILSLMYRTGRSHVAV